MAEYYTSRGDQGETDQLGKNRISKSHIRIQCLGALDEASAALGLARAQAKDPDLHKITREIQSDLYRIMTLAALEEPNPEKFPDLKSERISWLEEVTDQYGNRTESPKGFILPGENLPSAAYGLARTVIRRAERCLVELNELRLLYSAASLPYLNRLSSFCFVIELYLSQNLPSSEDQ